MVNLYRYDAARFFLECGVSMNFKAGYEQRTPVHMAATVAGCEELLGWMLKNGWAVQVEFSCDT